MSSPTPGWIPLPWRMLMVMERNEILRRSFTVEHITRFEVQIFWIVIPYILR
jgi:hypothetical protein